MIALTTFIGIADVGSCEATPTVGDLQTGDPLAWLHLRIAHNEWLDKLKDRAERGVIEAHPGDGLKRSRCDKSSPSDPGCTRRMRVATDPYPRAESAGGRCPPIHERCRFARVALIAGRSVHRSDGPALPCGATGAWAMGGLHVAMAVRSKVKSASIAA